MAKIETILRKAIDDLPKQDRAQRMRIYTRAYLAVRRQMDRMNPRPPRAMFDRQIAKVEDAILNVESSFSEDDPTAELAHMTDEENSDIDRPDLSTGSDAFLALTLAELEELTHDAIEREKSHWTPTQLMRLWASEHDGSSSIRFPPINLVAHDEPGLSFQPRDDGRYRLKRSGKASTDDLNDVSLLWGELVEITALMIEKASVSNTHTEMSVVI
ncbi:hypothetical protein [Martelella mediterranea]|uniref:Uncharacterized protein n=1 Tax=Martelella mediterranea TaxID=293089 RepID=A0A4R3NS46_9HYPH|nr:hypothetical protein [Martelella mediterranea]TCT39616.1 hypothetical protein EDC90_1012114 [Martelella mediterranea]